MSDTIVVRPQWPAVFAGFVIGVVVTLGTAGGLYIKYLWKPQQAAVASGPPPLVRPDFTQKVKGKTEAEVIAAVGPPNDTSEDPDTRTKFWHFKRRTKDPVSEAIDTDVQVVIQDGRVTAINY